MSLVTTNRRCMKSSKERAAEFASVLVDQIFSIVMTSIGLSCNYLPQLSVNVSELICSCIGDFGGKYCERSANCECLQALDCPQSGKYPTACFFKSNGSTCGSCYYKCSNNYWLPSYDPNSDRMPASFTCKNVQCNGGKCAIDNRGIPFCKCKDKSYIGENCERRLSRCSIRNSVDPLKCRHGGHCRDNGVARCVCPAGTTGDTCEQLIDSCASNPCRRGKCHPLFNGTYYCECESGAFGPNCEELIDPCEIRGQPCGNGKCVTKSFGYDGDYECQCNDGWDPNSNCLALVDLCPRNECQNGASCKMSGAGNYTCLCADKSFGGKYCEKKVDYCQPNPCLNDGLCVQFETSEGSTEFECKCKEQFEGDNCEILTDSCKSVECEHNGRCSSWGSFWNCTCVDGFTGQYCQNSPSLCNDPTYCNEGECVKSVENFDYCNCHAGYTGLRCESRTTDNFNLHFTGIQANGTKRQQIKAQVDDYRFQSALTFCAWVKYERKSTSLDSDSPFAVLFYLSNDQWMPLFWASDSGVASPGNLQISHKLDNDQWYHIAIVCKPEDSTITLYVNGKKVQSAGLSIPPEGSFRVVAGEQTNGEQSFVGDISLMQVFDRMFTDTEFSDMLVNCPVFARRSPTGLVISWKSYTTVDQYNYAVIVSVPGICVTSTCLPGQSDCFPEHDKTPPSVVSCPKNQYKISKERLIAIEWSDVVFKDENIIMSVDSNFRNGQKFSWGLYHIVYLATDRAGNTAICEFDVIVSPETCQNPVATDSITVNNTQLDSVHYFRDQAKMLSVISCSNEGFVFTQERPPFYVCDLMGRWDRFANLGSRYNLPSCSSTTNALQTVNGGINIRSCELIGQLYGKIRSAIVAASDVLHFCDAPECAGQLKISDNCSSLDWLRPRRQSTLSSASFTVSYQLNITNTPYAVAPTLNQTFNVTFGEHSLNIDTKFNCTSGKYPLYHRSGDQNDPTEQQNLCATCAAGEYYDKVNNACVKCPINTYKASEGVEQCTPCPYEKITGNKTGSVDEIDCYPNCAAGQFYSNLDDKCLPCSIGTYMPDAGRFKCRSCPLQSTTSKLGATSINECDVHCKAGEEMSENETCSKCPVKSYRTDEMSSCKNCNRGFSTNGPGANSPQKCSVVSCPPGHYGKADQKSVNQETTTFDEICSQCNYGYYQESEHQLSCNKCPEGKTTAQRGSTSVDFCTVDSSSSCNPTHPECPSGTECVLLDSGAYECRKVNIKNEKIQHFVQPWIWLVISAVGIVVVLVLLFVVVSHREGLLRFLDERFPGLLRCFELKEGGRRFSLDPMRDTNNLPFTPDNNRTPAETNPIGLARQTNVDELDRESWSTSDSVQNSIPSRWSTRRSLKDPEPYTNVPNFNADSVDTLNEIRSGLIEAMDGSIESDTSSHCISSPPTSNHGLRVETKPPPLVGLSHRRRSLTEDEQNDNTYDKIQMTTQATAANAYGHQFLSRFNQSDQAYAWSKHHKMRTPEDVSYVGDSRRRSSLIAARILPIKDSSPHNDDENDFFC